MLRTIKAKFKDGVLVPLEPVKFEEGDEILISFDFDTGNGGGSKKPSKEQTIAALRETSGAWRGSHDPEELKRRIYSERVSGSSPTPEI